MNVDLVSASNLSASLLPVSITAFRPISVHQELESLMDLSERCVYVGKYFAGWKGQISIAFFQLKGTHSMLSKCLTWGFELQ